MNRKIKSQKEIIKIAERLKKRGKKIITVSGGFDLLHIGHVKVLQLAKRQGDILIVLLNSDKSVQSYKGPRRPIVREYDRAEILAGLECVDYVTIFHEINPKRLLVKIKPHLFCHGAEWGKNSVARKVVEEGGGRIYVYALPRFQETTNLIKKILAVYQKPQPKALFLEADFIRELRGLRSPKKKLREYRILSVPKKGNYKELADFFVKSAKKYKLSLNNSWFITKSDVGVVSGREVNLKTIKIGGITDPNLKLEPHFYTLNLKKALAVIS